MPVLLDMIKPDIPAIRAIEAAFEELTVAEQQFIEERMNTVFSQGIPLELKMDKILYIQLFSLLLQLEVIALQIPLRFGPKMKTPEFQQQMRSQLVDEVFHCLIFAKILNHLCLPHAYFPAPNLEMEAARCFIFAEDNPDVALVFLNLIGEAWTELLFSLLMENQIAPELFAVIIADEKRHVSEALMYSQMQSTDKEMMTQKCHQFEPLLLNLCQFHFLVMAEKLCGIEAVQGFIQQLNSRYKKSLNEIHIKPSEHWEKAIVFINQLLANMGAVFKQMKPIPMTPLRQAQMVMWTTPTEATMAGQFSVDISDLDLFAKKFPPETLTSLMIQATSLVIANQPEFRNFLSFNQMYQYQAGALVGIVVKLPNCGDHLATIVLEDAHLMDIRSLSKQIRDVIAVMVFCYHECRKLEQAHPELAFFHQAWLKSLRDPFYPIPIPTAPFVSLSNIAMSGLYTGTSPLMKNEAVKLTLLRAEKKQVFDPKTSNFVVKDILPVCLSADHRVFDANWPMQSYFQESFTQVLSQVQSGKGLKYNDIDILSLINKMSHELDAFPGLQYQCFSMLQTLWPSFMMSNQNAFGLKVLEKWL